MSPSRIVVTRDNRKRSVRTTHLNFLRLVHVLNSRPTQRGKLVTHRTIPFRTSRLALTGRSDQTASDWPLRSAWTESSAEPIRSQWLPAADRFRPVIRSCPSRAPAVPGGWPQAAQSRNAPRRFSRSSPIGAIVIKIPPTSADPRARSSGPEAARFGRLKAGLAGQGALPADNSLGAEGPPRWPMRWQALPARAASVDEWIVPKMNAAPPWPCWPERRPMKCPVERSRSPVRACFATASCRRSRQGALPHPTRRRNPSRCPCSHASSRLPAAMQAVRRESAARALKRNPRLKMKVWSKQLAPQRGRWAAAHRGRPAPGSVLGVVTGIHQGNHLRTGQLRDCRVTRKKHPLGVEGGEQVTPFSAGTPDRAEPKWGGFRYTASVLRLRSLNGSSATKSQRTVKLPAHSEQADQGGCRRSN